MHAPDRGQIEFYAEQARRAFGRRACSASSASPPATTTRSSSCTCRGRRGPCASTRSTTAGTFRIDRLDVTPRPGPRSPSSTPCGESCGSCARTATPGRCCCAGWRCLLTGRWGEVAEKWGLGLHDPRCTRHGFYEPEKAYDEWIERRQLTDADRAEQREWADALADPPTISRADAGLQHAERFLRLAIESVPRQTYPHWELCVADDGSTAATRPAGARRVRGPDDRIKLAPRRPARRHLGRDPTPPSPWPPATTSRLLDHDDEIAEHALYRMAKAIVADPSRRHALQRRGQAAARRQAGRAVLQAGLVAGVLPRLHVHLPPRASTARRWSANVGGFRPEFDGAQDYDLVLRLIEQTDRIVHVPDVLYHWRLLPGLDGLRASAAKPHAHAAGLRALKAHLGPHRPPGTADVGPSAGLNCVRFDVVGEPLGQHHHPEPVPAGAGRQGRESFAPRTAASPASCAAAGTGV